jgi:hypothetical protein
VDVGEWSRSNLEAAQQGPDDDAVSELGRHSAIRPPSPDAAILQVHRMMISSHYHIYMKYLVNIYFNRL